MSQVRLDFMGSVSPVEKKVYVVSNVVSPVRNLGRSGAVFATTEGTRRKLGVGRIRGEFSCDK